MVGKSVSLSVRPDRGTKLHVENMRSCLGGCSDTGNEQSVRVVAVIVQNQFRPATTQSSDQLLHEARGAETCHILKPKDDVACGLVFDLLP